MNIPVERAVRSWMQANAISTMKDWVSVGCCIIAIVVLTSLFVHERGKRISQEARKR